MDKRRRDSKCCKRILSVVLSAVLMIPMLAEVPAKEMSKVEAATTLSNPSTNNGVVTWDCVYFGRYAQASSDPSSKQAIKWRVLSVDGDDAFLVADQNLDVHEYHYDFLATTWETSTVRSWLNGYSRTNNNGNKDFTTDNFIDRAFYTKEQAAIKTTKVVNPDHPDSDMATDGGNDTEDKLFLLSYYEATNSVYGFSSDDTRIRTNTAYVAAGGSNGSKYTEDEGKPNLWWLRTSAGYSSKLAVYVNKTGKVLTEGYDVDSDKIGICPALHLDLSETKLWSYAGTVSSDGTSTAGDKPPVVDDTDDSEEGDSSSTGTYEDTTVEGSSENTVEYKGPSDESAEEVKVPDTVTSPNGVTYKVTSIAEGAFKNNKKIKKITIGKNITTIGKDAFKGCTNLKTVTIGDDVTTIGANAFYGCSKLTTVKLGKNVTDIGSKAFYKCKKLSKITIPSKVKKIGNQAFYACSGLKTVKMGSGVTTIGEKAFYKCTKLASITIPSKVKQIGKQAFCGCKKLKKITIKTKLLNGSRLKKQAFKGIYSKATIDVPNGKLKAYKKLLKSRGVSSKAKIK